MKKVESATQSLLSDLENSPLKGELLRQVFVSHEADAAQRMRILDQYQRAQHLLERQVAIQKELEKQAYKLRVGMRVGQRLSEIRVVRAPGFAFTRLVGSFLPRQLREAVEAQHADALSYYVELLAANDLWGARKVAFMMHVWILWSIAASAIPLMLGMFKSTAGASKE